MKKIPLFLLLFSVSFSAFAAKAGNFSLEIEPLFGLKSGQFDEFVFLKNSDYGDDKLSELNWEIRHEYYAGIKLKGGFRNVFAETSFFAGIPSEVGEMKDSDWLNILATATGAEDYQYKTNYSESDNFLKYDFSCDLKAGYVFHLPEFKSLRTSVKPFLGFQYKNIKFDGKNGTAWYGTAENGIYTKWNDTEKQILKEFSGKVISYERQSSIFWIGADSEFEFLEDFSFFAGFKVSPYLYCESVDEHFLKDSDYLDVTPGFFAAFDFSLGAEYKITERQSLCLCAEYFHMRTLRGDDYTKTSSQKKFSSSNKSSEVDGGAAEHYLAVSLSCKFKIL